MINSENRERRDWTLLIFIIPIGIILIILVGQLAVRLVPFWRVDAGMNSNLEPNPESARPFALLEPILPQILTPMAWAQTYLTPGADISFPPFLTFEPTASPSPTAATPSPTSSTPSPTATTSTPVPTSTTGTPPPPTEETPSLCENPSAINYGGPLPCEFPPNDIPGCMNPAASNYNPLATVDDGSCVLPPVSGCTDPLALNYNPAATVDDGSCTYPPVLGCTDPLALNYNPLATVDDGSCVFPPTPTPTGTPVVIPTDEYTQVTPTIPTTVPDGNPVGIVDGTYVLINFGLYGTPVIVLATPDDFYDLIFYEVENGSSGNIQLDNVIIGITNDINTGYYTVFSWGDTTPDTNTNANIEELPADPPCNPGEECDNYDIDMTELYPNPGTGILIDVDTAPGAPPPNSYNFVVIIAPTTGPSGNNAQVDALVVTEVPTPTPVATP